MTTHDDDHDDDDNIDDIARQRRYKDTSVGVLRPKMLIAFVIRGRAVTEHLLK